jgi:precorrin-6Y C5,15-methyltransferase (decarboxylating)
MEPCIDVIGIGADGLASLRAELVERIRAADFLAGGERQLSLVGPTHAERYVIKDNIRALIRELWQRAAEKQRCVVLASGDPLFYGIGSSLLAQSHVVEYLQWGEPSLRFEPTLSSMQLAFARARVAWHDAILVSVHGRDFRTQLLPLLGRRKIGLLTSDGDSPARVAQFFLEHGCDDYLAFVGENLGAPSENLSYWPDLASLAQARCAPLNFLILYRCRYDRFCGHSSPATLVPYLLADLDYLTAPDAYVPSAAERLQAMVPGVPDDEFERPTDRPEVMTRREVRSIVLGPLVAQLVPGDIVWDIGAGLGTVAIEVAISRREVEVLAIERDPERIDYLRKNIRKFEAYNVRVIEGTAPDVFAHEDQPPQAIFIGGSGSQLPAILDEAAQRLLDGGRLVANFVTLENLTLTLDRLRHWQWPFEITEVHISRSDSLAGLTGLQPQRGVFIVSAQKRKRDHE